MFRSLTQSIASILARRVISRYQREVRCVPAELLKPTAVGIEADPFNKAKKG